MILLDKKEYEKVIKPLKKVKINNLFARAVIEQKVDGLVYVNDDKIPTTFYIVHPYGMSLLFGKTDNKEFNLKFIDYSLNFRQTRNKYEWMQAYPKTWDSVLIKLFENYIIKASDNINNKERGIIELNTRINFKFNHKKYNDFKNNLPSLNLKIIRTDKQIFDEMKGSVVPSHFWNNSDDFLKNGVGFSLFYNDILASTAYSAFIHDDKLELGIETVDKFRGKGFAQYVCAALIDYSIENDYEPIWACRLENIGSYKLAQKLGFEPIKKIPYYRLSK